MADPQVDTPVAVPIAPIITVGEFATKIDQPVAKVIGELMRNGVMASINETIDFDTAAIIGADLGVTIEPESAAKSDVADKIADVGEARPPVVAVMGHVDHGKTSLLDAIRSAEVAAGEAGGITQHIGAYQIKRKDRWITFLDTPGHEAFAAIRAHGARMTDVAIIVVAADDGVKPQTEEAIKYAQDAGVQIVIAVNKIDKPGADPTRVRQELAEMGLNPEEWGGKTVMVDVSAKAGTNIDQLLDLVLLVADLQELKARPDGPAEGQVVEAHLDSGKGPVATVLVQNGVLKAGDFIVAGSTYAKVRSLGDWRGKKIDRANPGMPAVVTGFKEVPSFGDLFFAADNEQAARQKALDSKRATQVKSMVKVKKIGVDELKDAITAGKIKELNVVVKADVSGSLESLTDSLAQLRNDEVAIKIVGSGIGDVSESDITLAKASHALVLGFNVAISSTVKQLATRELVKVQLYKVIYELLGDMRTVLGEMLTPEAIETAVGTLEILGVFKTTKTYVVCGGKVTSGKVEPKLDLKIKRGKEIIGEGRVSSLQKEKQPAKVVHEGELCGLNVETATPIAVGDSLEFITTETRARTL